MIKHFAKRSIAVLLTATLFSAWPQASVWAAKRVVLEGIEVSNDKVTAYLSEKTEFKTFTLK